MCLNSDQQVCSLVLEDGTVLSGYSFGALQPVSGEVGKLINQQNLLDPNLISRYRRGPTNMNIFEQFLLGLQKPDWTADQCSFFLRVGI